MWTLSFLKETDIQHQSSLGYMNVYLATNSGGHLCTSSLRCNCTFCSMTEYFQEESGWCVIEQVRQKWSVKDFSGVVVRAGCSVIECVTCTVVLCLAVWRWSGLVTVGGSTGMRRCTMRSQTPPQSRAPQHSTRSWDRSSTSSQTRPELSHRSLSTSWCLCKVCHVFTPDVL